MKLRDIFAFFCLLFISACDTNSPTNPIRVHVIDGQGKGIANATVVVGTQTGAIATFSSTDDTGETYFGSAPPNATVTAAFSCYAPSANRTYYFVDTAYGVNVSAVTLSLGTCDESRQSVNVNVTDAVAGITRREVTLGPITYGGSSVTMETSYSVQDDGNISIFATGYDDADAIKGYGFALDRPAVDGSAIDVAIDRTDLTQYTHRFGNVPTNAIGYFAYASLIRKHAATNVPFNFAGGAAPIPATVTTYSSGSFADSCQFGASIDLDRDGDGNADATIGLGRYVRNPSDQLFDFSLTPPVPSNLAINPGTAGRPVISWSNNDSPSTVRTITFSNRETTPQRRSFYYSMTVPGSATGLVFPELPDALAAFRPGAYSDLSLVSITFDGPASYADYLKAVADYKGYYYEAAGLSSYGYSRISP